MSGRSRTRISGKEGGTDAPNAEATSVEVATCLKHLLWSLPPNVHQRCDALTSSRGFTSALCGNKDALAPCNRKLDGAGESWSFLHSKNEGEKSVFAGNYTPLGAGVMFSTGYQLTKSG